MVLLETRGWEIMSECSICHTNIKVQHSHDIPKYIGGKDSDGMKFLCEVHHREYDLFLLRFFLKSIGEFPKFEEWIEIMQWQFELKKRKNLHKKLQKIAKKISSYYFMNYIKRDVIPEIIFCQYCNNEIDFEDMFLNNICPTCNRSQNNNKEVVY